MKNNDDKMTGDYQSQPNDYADNGAQVLSSKLTRGPVGLGKCVI